jgi:hypothetical protein
MRLPRLLFALTACTLIGCGSLRENETTEDASCFEITQSGGWSIASYESAIASSDVLASALPTDLSFLPPWVTDFATADLISPADEHGEALHLSTTDPNARIVTLAVTPHMLCEVSDANEVVDADDDLRFQVWTTADGLSRRARLDSYVTKRT